jgi:hypothetical protein
MEGGRCNSIPFHYSFFGAEKPTFSIQHKARRNPKCSLKSNLDDLILAILNQVGYKLDALP